MTDVTNVTADWTGGDEWRSVRSSGYVAAIVRNTGDYKAAYFDCPLITQVGDTDLWQGGCKQDVEIGDFFPTVVSLYPWERYSIADNVDRTEVTMYDSSDGVLMESLLEASDAVLAGLEKGRVLVHCQAGLNRSGLVSAFTLMRQGMSAQEAIDLLRRERDGKVLCNQTFVKQLHDLEDRRSEWA